MEVKTSKQSSYSKHFKNNFKPVGYNQPPTSTNKVLLPENSSRKSYADYEEITINKMEKSQIDDNDLITVADNFDAVGQVAFAGCSRLNPMQSLVFETAYKTNKNMLVAAPTGSGKTNVAMMAILKELKQYYKPNSIEPIDPNFSEKFKIIYIAPMKSLATEQTNNFHTKLKKIGVKARELTGDMSMTEREMAQTHIIVTTPEKWDVVTRKSKGDVDLMSLVRLLIIDEIHLLQSDRGPVLEALVARTLRYVESSQKMTRIVGLSATLPNFLDVAAFLCVNPNEGLYYFDNSFRPVPLTQTFIGVRHQDSNSQSKAMDRICYNLLIQYLTQSKQVMIFVHARNSTQRVANKIRELIVLNNKLELFQPDLTAIPEAAKMINSKNKMLRDLFAIGFGIHHAGMIRQDRLLVEKLFRDGVLKVLVCTATLAWGVNFPAHAVIIRGTEIYDSAAGKFVDVGLLDVMQIFGRAGRPQYDTDGHAILMSSLDKMDGYLRLLTNQTPIESNFNKHLADNLNAEIVSGTVSTIDEGIEWLKYTYLNIRLGQNPLAYGFEQYEIDIDPSLTAIRSRIIKAAAMELETARMCRYNEDFGQLEATDLGRIASHYYINHSTITRYNEIFTDNLDPQDILGVIGEAQEFQQIKFREEEANELDKLRRDCHLSIAGGILENTKGKVSCLIQAYISRSFINTHSLISDIMYIAQNATRIGRGLFEYSLKRGWSMSALNLLKICKMIELRSWDFQSPFRHFEHLDRQIITRLEDTKISIEQLDNMTIQEVAKLVRYPDKMGQTIKECLRQLPYAVVDGEVKTVKSNLISLHLTVYPNFDWNDRYHGKHRQNFWLWVVDEEITKQMYHYELIKFSKEQVKKKQPQSLRFNLPLIDDTLEDGALGQRIPNEYIVFVFSDQWIGCDYEYPIDCRKISLPSEVTAYTTISPNLNQLTLNIFQNELIAEVYKSSNQFQVSSSSKSSHRSKSSHQDQNTNLLNTMSIFKFEAFNLMQSHVVFPLYRCDKNVLICGPPGSGKTLLADLAMLKIFAFKSASKNQSATKHKTIYVTPIESLASLKYRDWSSRICCKLDKQIMLFSERNLFDTNGFNQAEVVVASAQRFYLWLCKPDSMQQLQSVAVIIFDDLHLLGEKRGSQMELVIAKLNLLKSVNQKLRCRFVGISNTISNAHDLANWLGIRKTGAYNFHPTTSRPIQLDIHISGFSERHYSPRMASMNKPIFKAINNHSPKDPVIVFVSSKKQCSSTALELISCVVYEQSHEKPWLHIDDAALYSLFERIHDNDLKLSLEFGIGFLFPSMKFTDKRTVEELYLYNKIQVLICTTNYVWESDLRARLVIVKGTEHYDDDMDRFTDYHPTDVVQMLGKAGRAGLDSTGVAVLMIRDVHKEFYKKFLHEPFPVESRILQEDQLVLANFLKQNPADLVELKQVVVQLSAPQDTGDAKVETSLQKVASQDSGFVNGDKQLAGQDDDVSASRFATTKKRAADGLLAIKENCLRNLSHTLLARRLDKNPSFYGLNDGKSPQEFLSRFIDTCELLLEQ